MDTHAQTIEAIVGSAVGLTVLGGWAVRRIVKPLRRIADQVEAAATVVEGTPERKAPNGYVIEPARPSVVEQFQRHGEALERLETGVAGLYPRMERVEQQLARGGPPSGP